jgi:hypothetical protein
LSWLEKFHNSRSPVAVLAVGAGAGDPPLIGADPPPDGPVDGDDAGLLLLEQPLTISPAPARTTPDKNERRLS